MSLACWLFLVLSAALRLLVSSHPAQGQQLSLLWRGGRDGILIGSGINSLIPYQQLGEVFLMGLPWPSPLLLDFIRFCCICSSSGASDLTLS